jgi:hypothetical protein
MVEHYPYTVAVKGSNPLVITLVRNSTGSEYRSFTPGVVSSNLTGPTKYQNGDLIGLFELTALNSIKSFNPPKSLFRQKGMNSSTAEQRSVKPQVESSNLSSSAR